jgi:hypothetical protein
VSSIIRAWLETVLTDQVNRLLVIATLYLHRSLPWVQVARLRMVNVAEPTNTPAPTRLSVPAAAPVAGAAIAPVTAMLAVSPNLEPVKVAPTRSRLMVLAVLMAKLAKASARVNVAVLLDSAERLGISAVLAASLCSELVILLDRTLRPTALAVPTARHA